MCGFFGLSVFWGGGCAKCTPPLPTFWPRLIKQSLQLVYVALILLSDISLSLQRRARAFWGEINPAAKGFVVEGFIFIGLQRISFFPTSIRSLELRSTWPWSPGTLAGSIKGGGKEGIQGVRKECLFFIANCWGLFAEGSREGGNQAVL